MQRRSAVAIASLRGATLACVKPHETKGDGAMRRAAILVLMSILAGATMGTGMAQDEPSPYPPECKPPVAFVSFTLAESGEGPKTAEGALPPEVKDEVGEAETTPEGHLQFDTPEGEVYVVTEISDGFALERMRVCGGEVGEGADQ